MSLLPLLLYGICLPLKVVLVEVVVCVIAGCC